MGNILVTGSSGQIGSELIPALSAIHSPQNVFSVDIASPSQLPTNFFTLDITDGGKLDDFIARHHIDTVYHLASLLSGASEADPATAWAVNLGSLKILLDLAAKYNLRIFWPSSIAAFGPTTPKQAVPQHTILEPTTIYGVTKVAGELLCQYYHQKFAVDVRSVRFPGIITWRTPPGAGTTEYAVDMLRHAAENKPFICFLGPESRLPMMYVTDAVKAAVNIMTADPARLTVRTSYNLSAFDFTPAELAAEISKSTPLSLSYNPDFHQAIADSWPQSIDDSAARSDWSWQPEYDFSHMVTEILNNLKNT